MYTINEEGLLNNYATEPVMYYAEFPSTEQQRQYVFQAAVAGFLVVATFLTALAVS